MSLSDGCAVERIAEHPAPDGSRTLILYWHDCGATTDTSTRAALLPGPTPDPPPAEADILRLRGRHDLRARWIDPTTIELTLPAGELGADAVVLRETRRDGVTIVHR